jgi:LmbE family N-acetylglucosaminyl deacetylase
MADALRLLCVVAHPDDEALGFGGILARYGAEGVATFVLTATRGQYGWTGDQRTYPGPRALGMIREGELRKAARVLGVQELAILDYVDGELAAVDPAEAIARVATHICQVRPDVVVTFGPDGATGHPDHIAICQLTTAAIVCAADHEYARQYNVEPYTVSKLYYMAETRARIATYESVFGDVAMTVDSVKRTTPGWPEWAITTRIDTSGYWMLVWEAIACHRSQLPSYEQLADLDDERHRELWGTQQFYRIHSLVNAGRAPEDDLFAGLR